MKLLKLALFELLAAQHDSNTLVWWVWQEPHACSGWVRGRCVQRSLAAEACSLHTGEETAPQYRQVVGKRKLSGCSATLKLSEALQEGNSSKRVVVLRFCFHQGWSGFQKWCQMQESLNHVNQFKVALMPVLTTRYGSAYATVQTPV